MKSRDQISLEEAYELVRESEASFNWEDFKDSKRPVYYMYEPKVPLKPGDLGFVPIRDDSSWNDIVDQEVAEPLRSMYKTIRGQIVEYVGAKALPINRIYKNPQTDNVTEAVTIVKFPDKDTLYGCISSLERPTEEQLKLHNMKKELPELEGIF